MPKRKTGLPKPKQLYLNPVFVAHQPGQIVPGRGKVRRVPFQRERGLTRLKIQELPDGRITVPQYRFNPETQELERYGKGHSVFKDVNEAMRAMGWHIPENVRQETKRMHQLYNQLRELHAVIADHWNRMNEQQRTIAVRRLRTSARFLSKNPELLQSKTKIKAFERMNRAADLLEEGNQMAALLSIRGIANDSLQRFNELVGQRPMLSRRERSLRKFKTEREQRIFAGLRALVGEFGKIQRLSGMSTSDRIRFLRTIQDWQRYFSHPNRSKIENFGRAAEQLAQANQAAQQKNYRMSGERMREASRLIALEISKTADLWGDLIQLIGQSKDLFFKKQVMKQQAKLVQENLAYWISKGLPEGFRDWPHAMPKEPRMVSDFFTDWSKIAKNSGLPEIARAFIKARTAFNMGNISSCEKALEGIAKRLAA